MQKKFNLLLLSWKKQKESHVKNHSVSLLTCNCRDKWFTWSWKIYVLFISIQSLCVCWDVFESYPHQETGIEINTLTLISLYSFAFFQGCVTGLSIDFWFFHMIRTMTSWCVGTIRKVFCAQNRFIFFFCTSGTTYFCMLFATGCKIRLEEFSIPLVAPLSFLLIFLVLIFTFYKARMSLPFCFFIFNMFSYQNALIMPVTYSHTL